MKITKVFFAVFFLNLIAGSGVFALNQPDNEVKAPVKAVRILEKITSPDSTDFSPSISPNGKFLLFNSKRNGERYMDIYISDFKHGEWIRPRKFDILNSPYNDETPYISQDGTVIIFSSDRDGSKELHFGAGKTLVSYDLYWSHLIDGQWSEPVAIPGFVNTPYHEKSPSLSKDNKTLYFSRWKAGNLPSSVVYSAQWNGESFETPTAMPAPINSKNMELALLPDPEGNGFYFSSHRSGGLGGWDIYYISNHNGEYGIPVNLGEKINSVFDEVFFTVLNGRIYFCSTQLSRGDRYQIMEAFLPGERNLYFKVVNTANEPVHVPVEVHKIYTNKIPEIKKVSSNSDGVFTEPLNDNLDSMDVFIEAKGYLPYYRKIENDENMDPQVEIILVPIKKNSSFTMQDIYFDYEKSEIKKESFPYLDRLSEYLKNNPTLKLQIIGHTDLHGSEAYNLELSKERAVAVENYLVKKGVGENRLNSLGAGKSQPVIDEVNSHADRLNRRTEFKILNE